MFCPFCPSEEGRGECMRERCELWVTGMAHGCSIRVIANSSVLSEQGIQLHHEKLGDMMLRLDAILKGMGQEQDEDEIQGEAEEERARCAAVEAERIMTGAADKPETNPTTLVCSVMEVGEVLSHLQATETGSSWGWTRDRVHHAVEMLENAMQRASKAGGA